jgi:uncharacterized membrane protein YfcA
MVDLLIGGLLTIGGLLMVVFNGPVSQAITEVQSAVFRSNLYSTPGWRRLVRIVTVPTGLVFAAGGIGLIESALRR